MNPTIGRHDYRQLGAILRSALVSEALDSLDCGASCFSLHTRRLTGSGALVGLAFPVLLVPIETRLEQPYSRLIAALDSVAKDHVLVIGCGGAVRAAVWGELCSTAARARGARGVVTDGPVRDLQQVTALDFPVFGRGGHPADVDGRLEWRAHNTPVEIDGVTVAPGDLIVADADGVVAVPEHLVDEVIDRVRAKALSENRFLDAVRGGMSVAQAYSEFGVL